ncbi:rhomboid family intramembrane serine protease [Chitinophagaceae bacterium LWZ2-11]
MNTLSKKVRLIYVPFLIILISFITLYTFLNWLLVIKTGTVHFKDEVIELWIPLLLPWIPVLIWLRPRIQLLNLNKVRNDNGPFLYMLTAALAISAPTIIAQKYLGTATGKLTLLTSINHIEEQPATKYYSITRHYIDKAHPSILNRSVVSGKGNNYLTFYMYLTLPVYESVADTSKGECSYWLGMQYSKQISNRLDKLEKENKFQEFLQETQNSFDVADVNQFVYLERAGNTETHDLYNRAVGRSNIMRYKDPVIFLSHNDSFEARNGNGFTWIFLSAGIGMLLWFLMLLNPKINEEKLKNIQQYNKPKYSRESLKTDFVLLLPREGYFITPILIITNIVIFVIMVCAGLGFVSFGAEDLLHWGGNFRPSTVNGEWWRLVTNIFLHGGIMHVLVNMYALLFVGIFLEPVLGRNKFAIVYLITGILASCASIWWHPATVSVGASGAIFGMYGTFLALLVMKVFPPEHNKAFLISTLIFIVFNLLAGFTGGIDNAAHIGGLLSGFVIGFLLIPSIKRNVSVEESVNEEDV